MRKVRIDYSGLVASKLLERSRFVHDGLNGNLSLTSPPVTVVVLNTQNTALQSAISAARNRDTHALALLREAKAVVVDSLRQNGDYVNSIASGDEPVLTSSGFELSKDATTGLPGIIEKIEAKFTNIPGTIDLFWKRAKLAHYYNVFVSTDGGTTWALLNTVIGRRILVERLNSNQRYMFKVVPIGVQGTGPESDIASQVAC